MLQVLIHKFNINFPSFFFYNFSWSIQFERRKNSRILKKLRGEIEVKSKTGEGTEFEVTLPIDLNKIKGVAS